MFGFPADRTAQFPTEITPWPTNGLRRASISSFGFGGSNSHAVLDDAYNFLRLRSLAGNHCTAKNPPSMDELDGQSGSSLALPLISNRSQQTTDRERANSASKLLVWSAADEGGLMRLARAYNLHLSHMSSAMNIDQANMYLEKPGLHTGCPKKFVALEVFCYNSFCYWAARSTYQAIKACQI